MEEESTVERYSRYLQNMNVGAMRSLQSNPDDLDTDCYANTAATNVLINEMFDVTNYTDGEINQAEFLEKFQVMSIVGMEQFEACGVNELLILFDGALNDLPRTISSLSNAATQIGVGWTDRNTAIYYSYEDIANAWGTEAYEELGYGLMLMLGQLLKYEAPGAVVEVSPTR